MRKLLVDTIQGKKEETVFNLNDFPFEHLATCNLCKKRGRIKYYNVASAFLLLRSCIIGNFVLIYL